MSENNSQKDLEVTRTKSIDLIADHVIKQHPWVRFDIVDEVLADPRLDETKRIKIMQLRNGVK